MDIKVVPAGPSPEADRVTELVAIALARMGQTVDPVPEVRVCTTVQAGMTR